MRRSLVLLLILAATACKPVPRADHSVSVPAAMRYDEAYRRLLTGMETCFKGGTIDHDLYTEIPEAEIALTRFNASTMFVTGTIVTSTTEHASELMHLSIKGDGPSASHVLVNDAFFEIFVRTSLIGAAECPTKKS